jgi:hypothetical protein
MKAQIVRAKNGWYIPDFPGFDDIRDDTVAVLVELDMAHEGAVSAVIDGKEEFRWRFGLESVNSLADLMGRLQ